MPSAALDVTNLCITIGETEVVQNANLAVGRGEVLALVGESGSGKSLTALALLGLLPRAARLTGGRIRLEGEDIARLPERRMRALRGRRISMIFQEPTAALDPLAPVGRQIAEALPGASPAHIVAMLAEVGIADPGASARQYPFELSGGMCQRAMIASALIAGPAVLIADEPTTALDVTIQAQILDLLRKLAHERQAGILLITHDLGVVADIADRVSVMYAGRIVETAPAWELFARPRHPYTALLLASIPRLSDTPKAQLRAIDGNVPSLTELGPGCRFAPRCPLAGERCVIAPPLEDRGGNHLSACWHVDRLP